MKKIVIARKLTLLVLLRESFHAENTLSLVFVDLLDLGIQLLLTSFKALNKLHHAFLALYKVCLKAFVA